MCDVQHECKHFIPRIPGACVCCGTTRATCVRLLWNNPCCLRACSLLDDTLCTPCEQPFPKPVLTYVSICQARTVCSPAYGRRGPASCRQIPRERGRLYRHFCACVMCSMNESIPYLESCASQLLARASRNCWRVHLATSQLLARARCPHLLVFVAHTRGNRVCARIWGVRRHTWTG